MRLKRNPIEKQFHELTNRTYIKYKHSLFSYGPTSKGLITLRREEEPRWPKGYIKLTKDDDEELEAKLESLMVYPFKIHLEGAYRPVTFYYNVNFDGKASLLYRKRAWPYGYDKTLVRPLPEVNEEAFIKVIMKEFYKSVMSELAWEKEDQSKLDKKGKKHDT